MKQTKASIKLSFDELLIDERQDIRYDLGEIGELAYSIENAGLIKPLLVTKVTAPEGEERYKIVDGHRRYEALKILNEKTPQSDIPAIKLSASIAEDDQFSYILLANSGKPMTALEQAEVYGRLHTEDQKKWSKSAMAKMTGKSIPHVTNMILLYQVSDEVKDAIKDNKIAATTVFDLIRSLKSVEKAEEQIKAMLSKHSAELDDADDLLEDVDEGDTGIELPTEPVKVVPKKLNAQVFKDPYEKKVAVSKLDEVKELWDIVKTATALDTDGEDFKNNLDKLQKDADDHIQLIDNIKMYLVGELSITDIFDDTQWSSMKSLLDTDESDPEELQEATEEVEDVYNDIDDTDLDALLAEFEDEDEDEDDED